MKFKDIANQSPDELKKKLTELEMDLMKDYVQIAAGTTPKNPGKVKQVKKSIAKIKMALHKHEE